MKDYINLLSGYVKEFRFIDDKNAWGVRNKNDYPLLDLLLLTSDGGRTWTEQKLPMRERK